MEAYYLRMEDGKVKINHMPYGFCGQTYMIEKKIGINFDTSKEKREKLLELYFEKNHQTSRSASQDRT